MHTHEKKPLGPELSAALNRSKALSEWLYGWMSETSSTEATRRNRATLAYAGLTMEHREALLLLIDVGAHASAMALTRSLLEAYALALWVGEIQDDAAFDMHVMQRHDPPAAGKIFQKLAKRAPGIGEGFFTALKNHYKTLCDYSHGGPRQLSRWVRSETIEPNYDDAQMAEVLRLSDVVCLLAAITQAGIMGHATEPLVDRLDSLFTELPADT